MALLSKSSRKLILYFCHLNLFHEAGQTCNGRNWLMTKFIPSNIPCVRVHSNHHRDHVHSIHHSGQDHSTARGQLQHQQKEKRQQRAQHQLPSSCVPKDHSVHSRSVRVRVHILRSIHGLVLRSNHHNTARGQHLGQQQQVLVQHRRMPQKRGREVPDTSCLKIVSPCTE